MNSFSSIETNSNNKTLTSFPISSENDSKPLKEEVPKSSSSVGLIYTMVIIIFILVLIPFMISCVTSCGFSSSFISSEEAFGHSVQTSANELKDVFGDIKDGLLDLQDDVQHWESLLTDSFNKWGSDIEGWGSKLPSWGSKIDKWGSDISSWGSTW